MVQKRLSWLVALAAIALLLVACQGYTTQGSKTVEHQGANGGDLTIEMGKANGTTTEDIEIKGESDLVLEADVTLFVGLGSFKIELLGQDDQVTLVLEAGAGEAAEGHGQMVTDSFGEASYRVTATDAENVTYFIEYTYR